MSNSPLLLEILDVLVVARKAPFWNAAKPTDLLAQATARAQRFAEHL